MSVLFVVMRFVFTPVRIKILTTVLPPAEYGLLTFISMSAHGAAMILSLGGFEFFLRELPGLDRQHRLGVLRGATLAALPALALFAGLLLLGVAPSAWFLGGEGMLPRVAALLFFLLFFHVQQRVYFLLGTQQHLKARVTQLAWSDLWFFPMLLLGAGASALMGVGIWTAWLVVLCLLTYRWVPMRQVWRRAKGEAVPVARVLAVGLPILPVVAAEWVFRLGGHYLLLVVRSAHEMALYALALNVALVGYAVGVPLVDITATEINACLRAGDPEDRHAEVCRLFSRGVRLCLAVSIPVGLAVLFLGDAVIAVLANPAFSDAAALLPPMACVPAGFLLNLLLSRMLVSRGGSRFIAEASLIGATVAVVLTWLFVGDHGALAAIWAMQVALLVVFAVLVFRLKAWQLLDAPALRPRRLVLGAAVLSVALWFVGDLACGPVMRLLVAMVICLCVVFGLGWLCVADFGSARSQPEGGGDA